MQEYPKTIQLRDKTEIILRPMTPEDGDRLHTFFTKLPVEDRQYLRNDVTDRAIIDKWIRNIDYDHILPILALENDEIVGDATLHVERYGWWRHLGEIRLVVAREYQRKGLGAALARDLYRHAQTRGLHKIMCQVLGGQTSAIRAMEKLGFVTEALLRKHVTDLKDKKHDLLIMTSNLDELWRKMEDAMEDLETRTLHAH